MNEPYPSSGGDLIGPAHGGPSMERVEIEGSALEYSVRGSGEPVLLIVALFADGLSRPLLGEGSLPSHYRVISYHPRGYGASPLGRTPISTGQRAADAADLLKHLRFGPAHIVGYSYGGVVALQMALDTPELVRSLALLEPAIQMVPSAGEVARRIHLPAREKYLAGDRLGALDHFLSAVAGPAWNGAVERAIPGGVRQAEADADTFWGVDLRALREWRFGPEQAARVSTPILSVRGARSAPFSAEVRQLLHSWFRDVEDFDVEGASHLLQIENPKEVARGLAEFFRRHPGTPDTHSPRAA